MKMLALDPSRRISMKEALKHPYFSDLNEKSLRQMNMNMPLILHRDERAYADCIDLA